MTERDVETWMNGSAGMVFVNKFSGNGNEVTQEGIQSGRSVILTTQERDILNTQRCYSSDVDPFKNGMLTPVTLASTSEDLIAVENPNHMTEAQALELFKVRQWKSFEKKIGAISSTALLHRMLKAAESTDDNVNAQMTQVRVLEERLEALTANDNVTQVETVGSIGSSGGMDY